MKPKFFPSPPDWHAWLEQHHDKHHDELWVGFYKSSSRKPSITWPEAVDGALCFGWIDGVRKSLDESQLCHSLYAATSAQRLERDQHQAGGELTSLGLMRPTGLAGL